ncbi:MAG: hypothetical protein QOE61_319, partial [Micromonosporaceae bacterium]|nr:hypothetical protein [Micromonosporaceae bacterium]
HGRFEISDHVGREFVNRGDPIAWAPEISPLLSLAVTAFTIGIAVAASAVRTRRAAPPNAVKDGVRSPDRRRCGRAAPGAERSARDHPGVRRAAGAATRPALRPEDRQRAPRRRSFPSNSSSAAGVGGGRPTSVCSGSGVLTSFPRARCAGQARGIRRPDIPPSTGSDTPVVAPAAGLARYATAAAT